MKNKFYITICIIIVVLTVTGAYLLFANNSRSKVSENTTQQTTQSSSDVTNIIKNTQSIILTPTGFDPKIVTINAGTRVLWSNQSGTNGTVNSDPYPTNVLWKFLNLGLFKDKENMSITFEKSGTYTYHNQLKPDQTGTVIVK